MNFSKSHILLVLVAFFSIFGFTGFILTVINLNNCNSQCNNYKITEPTTKYKKQTNKHNKKNDLLLKRQQNDLKYVLNKFKPHRNNQPSSNYTNITPISKVDQQYKVPQKHNNYNNNSQIQTYQMPKAIRTDRRKMLEPHQMIRSNQMNIPNSTPISSLV